MKLKLKEDYLGETFVKAKFTVEEFESLCSVLAYVRLGQNTVLSDTAFELMQFAEQNDLAIDDEAVSFEVALDTATEDMDVTING